MKNYEIVNTKGTVKSIEKVPKRSGGSFIKIKLRDQGSSIYVNLWNLKNKIKKNSKIELIGMKIQLYKGVKELNYQQFSKMEPMNDSSNDSRKESTNETSDESSNDSSNQSTSDSSDESTGESSDEST